MVRHPGSSTPNRWLLSVSPWILLLLVAVPAATTATTAATAAAPKAATAATAATPDSPRRVVAIGDIHGAFDAFVGILTRAELIDADLEWIGGDTVLVQTGDFLDKGPEVRAVMDLLMALEEAAPRHGGKVVVLMGNHEAMNIVGILRDASPEAFSAFADKGSEKRRQRALREHERGQIRRATELDQPAPVFDAASRKAWLDSHPPGRTEYLEAIGSRGRYGRWIRDRPLTERVGSSLFIHAGVPPELAATPLEELQAAIRQDIGRIDEDRKILLRRRVSLPSYSWEETQRAVADEFYGYRARGELREYLQPEEKEYMLWLADLLEVQGGSLTDSHGPLWYRGFARGGEKESRTLIEQLVARYGVERIAAGHTPRRDGHIQSRFDGQLFLIDTGMLEAVYDGRASALEIEGGRVRALYPNGDEELLVAAPEAVSSPALPDGSAD